MTQSKTSWRRCLILIRMVSVSLMIAIWGLECKPANTHLNFVFILIDDLGWTDVGCYGSSFYETPNIDRLTKQGMRFTNAYASSPVCSPTRASILSGKYPARLNLTQWIGGPGNPDYLRQLPLAEFTVAEAFKEAGYTTFFAGKWHLGKMPYWPEHQGFDINKAGHEAGGPWAGGYFSPYKFPNLEDGPEGEYLTERLTDESLKFLENNYQKPFLLYLSHYSVHTPLQIMPELEEKYKIKAKNLPLLAGPRFIAEGPKNEARQIQDHAVYAGMVEAMDTSVGLVMNKIEQLGIVEQTVIIFMSDNGGLSTSEGQPTSNVPLRAGKGWLYEGGIREPMIIKWPGVIKAGSTCEEMVTSTDFYPTMLEIAGLKPWPDQHLDGVSLVPLLRQSDGLDREALFWHYPHYSNQGGKPGAAVRSGDYKLIEFFEDKRVELYNLREDLSEKNDLSKILPGKKEKLLAMLHQWQKSVNAKYPDFNNSH
jgi:arylsulfatase A-like enzyme